MNTRHDDNRPKQSWKYPLLERVDGTSIGDILLPGLDVLVKCRDVRDELVDTEPDVLRRFEDVERDVVVVLERGKVLADILNQQLDELRSAVVRLPDDIGRDLTVVDKDGLRRSDKGRRRGRERDLRANDGLRLAVLVAVRMGSEKVRDCRHIVVGGRCRSRKNGLADLWGRREA